MLCHNCDHEIEYAAVCPYCGTRILREPLPHHLPTGTVIDNRYKIIGVLGEGGFGITYLGYNQKLGLPVAIKEYFPQGTTYRDTSGSNEVYVGSEDAESFFEHGKERFLSEAKTLVRFNSEPGIVSVMDFVEENKTAYLIMEYLDGETLQQYLKRHGKLSATETFEMLEPMMRTLEKVHAAGVIHRDISPDNIMRLKNGHLKLMDFGAAREFVDENRSMSIMLKKGYAPAEQYRRKGEQGPWTDVYALCATIYRCITGVTPTDSLDRMSGEELKKPSELGADIPPVLDALLMYGLALFKKDRCKSMTELLEYFEKCREALKKTAEKRSAQETTPQGTVQIDSQKEGQNKPKAAKNTTVAADSEIEKPQEQKEADPFATRYAEEPPIIKQNSKDKIQIQDNPSTENNKPKKKSRKKIVILTISIILIASILVLIVLRNNGDTYHGFHFRLIHDDSADNNTAVISGYFGLLPQELEIPSEVYGLTVTRIAIGAFSDEEGLKSVIIPDTVKLINQQAFEKCSNLKSVTIPESVTGIDSEVFSECISLTEVTIPDSVTSIGERAFYDCSSLTNVTIPDSVTSIGNYAFQDCRGIVSVSISQSVESIGIKTFNSCESLTNVTIPDSVTTICDGAFEDCTSLKNITVPDSVTSIGGWAFARCYSLTSITIPDSVTSIGEEAFRDCFSLTSITIPDSVTSIGDWAFFRCDDLTIYGKKGSAAEKYANDNGFEFREI